MKLLTTAGLRDWDAYTLQAQRVSLDALVARVGERCAAWLHAEFEAPVSFLVLCGTGLNGADGLQTARSLRRLGRAVKALVLRHRSDFNPVTVRACAALQNEGDGLLEILETGATLAALPLHIVVVDALTGTGLSRPLEGWLQEFAGRVNSLPNPVVSLDLPSGLPADCLPGAEDTILQAAHTLTFQTCKRSLLHPEGGRYAGGIHLLDIGLDPGFLPSVPAKYFTIDRIEAQARYRPRQPFSHKGTYGTAFLIGGSKGMVGAAVLALNAAGRAGAGKVRGLVPECGYTIAQTAVPEAMCITSGAEAIEAIDGWEGSNGIGIGPGLGQSEQAVAAFGAFLKACNQPVVLDADALTILSNNPAWWSRMPAGSILTPHPKEFERLFGKTGSTLEAVERARAMAMQHNVFIVLKDRHTAVCTPEGTCWYNTSGNAGLATGGSGDVLCGMITGLLASGYAPEDAALLGVWLHGRAGDGAAARRGMESLIAGDITDFLGAAFLELAEAPKSGLSSPVKT